MRWARRVIRNGPVVIIVSDGWDRGDPAVLARELARVRRSCRRLIWLNPLLGSPQYEPLTRGMQAALRHVDDFLPAHNLASLEQLANHLRPLPAQDAAGLMAAGYRIRIMELRGTTRIHAPSASVAWELLMDTDVIAQMSARMPRSAACRAGSLRGRSRCDCRSISGGFKGTVALEDKTPPHSYTLVVEGTGRPGFVKGQARVTLEAAGDRTLVQIAAQADVGGTIARLGQRLVEGVARTIGSTLLDEARGAGDLRHFEALLKRRERR